MLIILLMFFILVFNANNKEGSEAELQDKMEVESDNYHNDDDVSIEEDNDHYSEHYSEADNYIGEEDNDNYSEEADDYSEEADDYGEETNDNYIEKEDDNYGEEDDNNNENVYYDDSDNIIDNNDNYEEKIVDSSIDSDQMSKINGSFAPYFENLTSALLFCWVQKHNISTNAYNDLVEILQHQKFEVKDVVKNIRRFRQWKNRLPLMPIRTRSIKINPKKTPSTSKGTKLCYYLSIRDIIQNILNNPSLYDKLYFGPGVEAEEKKEYWHGDLWAESPLFGQEKITINRDQHLEEGSIIANTYEIIEKVDITIVRGSTIITNGLFIKEILYKNNGHWKLQDVALDYMHPCEYSALNSPPSPYNNLRILKIFIDIYYDDFGMYRNTYHSLGGVYIQLGNMPFEMRKHLRNHFILGFVPFGGCFEDFIRPFIKDMKQLEEGILMNVQGRDCWIVAGLGCVNADLPQGNDLTSVKRYGVIRGCRTCLAKENATDTTLDIASISRYHHITNIQFKNIFTATTLENQNNIAKEYGLRTSLPILDQLQRERHLQSPQDIYHIIAGKTLKLLKLTTAMLSLEGEQIFIEEWKSFEYPKQWSKLPNPISHLESFMMSDRVRLGMVMPFILNRSLTTNSLKQQEMDKLQRRTKLNCNQVINTIIKCWAIVAKCSQLAFKFSLTIDDYIELERYLKKEREALVEPKVRPQK
ncbi:hypothetical protein RhiirA1_402217 [Rhizophagus irregularis]|uniref:Uncharacterized protein n=1 Tax=Rhizophagus irregularis TaxID=588596 RepID=A0A2I1F5Q5_9GLOM|nr:hypothetical protein RhiirA1_402217 [Rhizophagus irregularis]PKY29711.1 hypothetical protein RhiirB3_392017 [Rhizophagus irregularis]